MQEQRIQILLDKYAQGICTGEELAELDAWYETLGTANKDRLPAAVYNNADRFLTDKLKAFKERVRHDKTHYKIRPWLKIAAAIILLLGTGTAIYLSVKNKNSNISHIVVNDVPPGHTGAILTLADGSTVLLDSAANGTIAKQGNVQINNNSGRLAYNGSVGRDAPVTYNTLTTPKARQYHVTLSDGTKVWLNAASSITYPTAFTGDDRMVTLTGEAYFEVVHNDAKPFRVKTANADIADIGTQFNVYAYGDEPETKTTLLEGAVKVNGKLLAPGQQAQITVNNTLKMIRLSDPESAIAWKKGEISFNNVDIPTLMRQLSRWYNVDIVYTGGIPAGHLFGVISRQTNLSVIISYLKENDIHCRLENNKLIIDP